MRAICRCLRPHFLFREWSTAVNLVYCLTAAICLAGGSDSDSADGPIGRQVPNFSLPDHLGARHSLQQWKGKPAFVIVFLGAECPLAKLYGPRLAELADRYQQRGVQVVGINANRQDTLQELGHYARRHQLNFPLLKDAGNRVADQFGAQRTPEAFVLDRDHVIRYRGRIDDQYGVGYSRAERTSSPLTEALDQVLAGVEVTKPTTEAVGCFIGRVRNQAPSGDVTYSRQIARLLQKHCTRCHRSGQIAPFALTDYEEVIGWADTIVEVMDDGRMPPWHASPEYGHFANDARMTVAEKDLFRKWVENGLPQGDPSDLPPPPDFNDGWQIGEPDAVYRMPEAFAVPAKGVVPYQ